MSHLKLCTQCLQHYQARDTTCPYCPDKRANARLRRVGFGRSLVAASLLGLAAIGAGEASANTIDSANIRPADAAENTAQGVPVLYPAYGRPPDLLPPEMEPIDNLVPPLVVKPPPPPTDRPSVPIDPITKRPIEPGLILTPVYGVSPIEFDVGE